MKVQYTKHPETPHWRHEPMVRLGEDEHGLWLGGTSETWLQKGEVADPQTLHESGFFSVNPFVQLIVPGAWWTLIYNGDEREISHYIDIVTPAEISDGQVLYTDLDLDVVRCSDGKVYVDDEDEFALHSETLEYPDFWIDKARTTTAALALRLGRLEEPFGRAAQNWRDHLLSLR